MLVQTRAYGYLWLSVDPEILEAKPQSKSKRGKPGPQFTVKDGWLWLTPDMTPSKAAQQVWDGVVCFVEDMWLA